MKHIESSSCFATSRLPVVTALDERDKAIAIIRKDPMNFVCLSNRLKSDEKVVLAAVKMFGFLLHYVPHHFRRDKKIVLIAVKSYPTALSKASSKLKDDEEVVFAAIKRDSIAFVYASDRLCFLIQKNLQAA
ncbi:MAG: DUF4116 domain-containing protein [Chlamydiae bacterium]|nr:DUF4116 domain-containing protein [Chlamydiota bacterium]